MTEKQKMLLELTIEILEYVNWIKGINEVFNEELKYDETKQDIWGLAEDLKNEFYI